MSDAHFVVEDNHSKPLSLDEVRISFLKDPLVGRVWTMSYEHLFELQTAITAHMNQKT